MSPRSAPLRGLTQLRDAPAPTSELERIRETLLTGAMSDRGMLPHERDLLDQTVIQLGGRNGPWSLTASVMVDLRRGKDPDTLLFSPRILCDGQFCDPQGVPPGCGAVLDQCDKKILGAGVTFPAGEGASNRRCDLFGGNRYIIDGEPDLTEAFTCIAQVGIDGAVISAEAMVNALTPELNGPLGCNEGFLRDDALLVVTLIQDTYDEDSAGSVESWIEALRTAKKGDDDAYAVLVLTTDIDKGPWELCAPGLYNETKNRLRLLVAGYHRVTGHERIFIAQQLALYRADITGRRSAGAMSVSRDCPAKRVRGYPADNCRT